MPLLKNILLILALALTALVVYSILTVDSRNKTRKKVNQEVTDCLFAMDNGYLSRDFEKLSAHITHCIKGLEFESLLYRKIDTVYYSAALDKAGLGQFEKADSVPVSVQNTFDKIFGVCTPPQMSAYHNTTRKMISLDSIDTYLVTYWDKI